MGNCLCVRKEVRGGEQFPTGPPTLYAKVPLSNETGEFLINFYEMRNVEDVEEPGWEANPKDYVGKRCYVKAVVKIDSIFISGSCIRLQVKVAEVNVKKSDPPRRRMISSARAHGGEDERR